MTPDAPESQSAGKRLSRRHYVKYAGAGVAAIGAATAAALFGLPMVDPYAFDRPPAADFEYKPYYSDPRHPINPRYANPTSGYTLQFLDRSTDPDNEENAQSQIKKFLRYRIPQPLSYSWYLDDALASTSKDFSTRLPANSSGAKHTVRLSVSDGRNSSTHEGTVVVDPDQVYPVSRLDVRLKGVAYWVDGLNPCYIGGPLNEERVNTDMSLIRDELGCNGIRVISGMCSDPFRLEWQEDLLRCAELAIRMDFENVTISPCYMDVTLEDTKERVRTFAKHAQALSRVSDATVFQVGSELSIVARGICVSRTY